jgi:DNA polymerase III epsilon subunit-like protein
VQPSHRALDDARATAAVLGQLLGRLTAREGLMTLDDLDAWLAARDAEAAVRQAEKAARGRDGTGAVSTLAGLLARLLRALRARLRPGGARAADRRR